MPKLRCSGARSPTTNVCSTLLTAPAVLTVLPGVRNLADLRTVLRYVSAAPEEQDDLVMGEFAPRDADGVCICCNHCRPCPWGLDVGLINKYYELALAGDAMAKGHYSILRQEQREWQPHRAQDMER